MDNYRLNFAIVIILAILPISGLFSQLLLNELSPDSGNNDSENDAIVELINVGMSTIDASCTVISNSEWVVVIPPGTMISAGDIFLIACGEGMNIGSNPNPSPGSGLTCANCDFPNLPLDFDVCDPANAAFVDYAATGFTLDNSKLDDGDQVILFDPLGNILDAVAWGCGSSLLATDNTTVADPSCTTSVGRGGGDTSYTLGFATWNGQGDQAQLPAALQVGGSCYNASVSYTMPPISSALYAVINPVQNSCNSSMVRTEGDIAMGAGGLWTQTEHPNPGQANNSTPYQFYIDGVAVSNGVINNTICTSPSATTIEVEIYNYQHVEDIAIYSTSSRTTIGSHFSLNGSAPTFWNNGVSGAGTGTTTLSHTFTPANGDQLILVWDDWTQSPLNPNCCGSGSVGTAQSGNDNVSQNGSDECYEAITLNYKVEIPITGSPIITCDDPITGEFSVSGISGGTSIIYKLVYIGPGSTPAGDELISSSTTGMFTLANNTDPDRNVPDNYTVIAVNACNMIVATGAACIGNPPCPDPQGATLNGATTPITICPADCFDLTVDGSSSSNLPDRGTIDWFYGTTTTFDPCDDMSVGFGGQLDNSSDISSVTGGGKVGIIINEVLYDPAVGDVSGANSNESLELFNNSNAPIDISNWVITDGDGEVVISSGTSIPSCGYLALVFPPALTNSGEQIAIYDNTGAYVDGMYWEGGSNINNPSSTQCTHDITIGGGTVTVNLCSDITGAGNINAGTAGNGESLELNADGTWSDVTPSSEPLTGGPNTDQTTCPMSASSTTVTIANNCFDASFCNNGPYYIKGVVNPAAVSSSCGKTDVTVGPFEINVVCPEVVLSGISEVCAPNEGVLDVYITNAPPNATIVGIAITNATSGNSFPVTSPAAPITDANGNANFSMTQIGESGDYTITSITINGSTCPVSSGIGTVNIFPQPDLILSGMTTVCPGEIAQLSVTINAGIAPIDVGVDQDGDSVVDFIATINNSGILNVPTSATDAGSTINISLLSSADENDCIGVVSGTGNIIVSALPGSVASAATSNVCTDDDNTSIDLSWTVVDPGSGFTVDLYDVAVGGVVLTGGNDLAGGTGDITFSQSGVLLGSTFPQTIIRYFEVTEIATGCINYTRTLVSVTVNANPNFTPVVTQPTCTADGVIEFPELSSGTYTYEFSTTGAAPYTTVTPMGGNITIAVPQGTQSANTYTIRTTRTDTDIDCESTEIVNIDAVTGCDSCSPPNINSQPMDANVCSSSIPVTQSYEVTATNNGTGTTLTYQWQVSTDDRATYSNIVGATNSLFSLNVTTASMDGNFYRVVVIDPIDTANCMVISEAAILNVDNVACTSFPWNGN